MASMSWESGSGGSWVRSLWACVGAVGGCGEGQAEGERGKGVGDSSSSVGSGLRGGVQLRFPVSGYTKELCLQLAGVVLSLLLRLRL